MPIRSVDIDLDKMRRIRFRHSDLADLEVAAGKGVGELVTSQSFHAMRMLLSFGLRWQDQKMSPARASELIQGWIDAGNTFESLQDRVVDALKASGYLKSQSEEGDAEGNDQAAGTKQPAALSTT